jgi:urease accessory protein
MIVYRTITAAICITTTIMTRIAITTITAIPVPTVTGKPPPRSRRRKAGTVAAVPNTPATRGRDRIDVTEAAALFRLLTWLSPSFPIGAFSYSSGIEWAVESGDISDAASLCNWLGTMLTDGSGFCDGVFLSQTHRATTLRDGAMLREIAELAAAFATSRERQLETSSQGRAFIDIARAAWNCDGLAQMIGCCDGAIVYPVAVGLVSAAHAIPLAPTMHGFLHAVVSNWISAAARLIPLGQTDSQRVLALLEQAVAATAGRALEASLDDLGSATFRADLASLRHETQYTRLFRS